MKILVINGCVRGGESRSLRLMQAFLDELKKIAPEHIPGASTKVTYEQLDLAQMDFRPLVGQFFEDRQTLLEEGNRTHPRFRFAHQFAEADYIVIAAPFWDLSVPAIVKLYIENISVDGITFGCNESGLYGMCRAKKMIYFTTRGAVYGDGPMEQGAKYLAALCEMFGVDQFQCVAADGVDLMPEKVDEIMSEAICEARKAAQQFLEVEE